MADTVAHMEKGDLVEFIGEERHDEDPYLHRGSPGTLWDVSRVEFGELYVTFVGGPSRCVRPSDIAPLSLEEYAARASRIGEGMHPLEDGGVAVLMDPATGWASGDDQLGA